MAERKKLSNPYSTGGGGVHFEAHVQASFVALMLTDGHAPCLPCWPIKEVKLQGKVDGFETDDLIVVVENQSTKDRRKLLGQIKHSISITQGSSKLADVIQAAWDDFNNTATFSRGNDIIALITGPISASDDRTVQWLLGQARHTSNVEEFLRNVHRSRFSPDKAPEKLDVFRHHLRDANGGNDVSSDELYEFLNCFHLLGYDLGSEFGVALSLLHSHISQFQKDYPQWVWSRVVDIVQTWNQDAGTITPDKLPEDLREAFAQKAVVEMPNELKEARGRPDTDWSQHVDASFLGLAVLLGAWQDASKCDRDVVEQLLGIDYEDWLQKAREILHRPDSPLTLKDGTWKVARRAELWSLLGSRILDGNLDEFNSLAVSVLGEPDPAFELPAEERYAASVYGKEPRCSQVLRKGIAEGLAILGTQSEVCVNCSRGKAEATSVLVVRDLIGQGDWVVWGSLNGLLPALAEAAPGEFLSAVEEAMRRESCPFDDLFEEEGDGVMGGNYLTGLLWALEGLAWEEQHLVRVCVVLGEIASHDPGGRWANRPANSLATILLPWLPQTLAPIEKRLVAVKAILREFPEVGWSLLIQLLPGQHQTSFGSHKPSWRDVIPSDWEKGVTQSEYWEQVSSYAELAVDEAGFDLERLSTLIDQIDSLTNSAIDRLLVVLASPSIAQLSEEQRLGIWGRLSRLTNKHRRFSDAEWALPGESLDRIERVLGQLAPANPFNLYRHLFSNRDFDLYDRNGDWDEQRKRLTQRREVAVAEIIRQDGIDGVVRFSESVPSADQVGYALASISDEDLEAALLPSFLVAQEKKRRALACSFVRQRCQNDGWGWCDHIEKSDWTAAQLSQFLACCPFTEGAWRRATDWLGEDEAQYWRRTGANPYEADGDLSIAVGKLIVNGRPHAAIDCLDRMRHAKQPIDSDQCVEALLAAVDSGESGHAMDQYQIVELIKFLHKDSSVSRDGLFSVEWAYIPLLNRYGGASPRLLEGRLANDADFFCEVIRLIYRSKSDDIPVEEVTEDSKAVAANAWRLLHEWKTPPGMQDDGAFCEECFVEWLGRVKELCTESGHLEVAMVHVGEVLIHAPPDPDGLWISRAVADALDERDSGDMRSGFRTGKFNSRGAHWVDPTGEPERKLAEGYRQQAEEVENAGYTRLAVTLKELAGSYDRDAERIISDHGDREGG